MRNFENFQPGNNGSTDDLEIRLSTHQDFCNENRNIIAFYVLIFYKLATDNELLQLQVEECKNLLEQAKMENEGLRDAIEYRMSMTENTA